jgi:hypothetical protein
MNNRSTFSKAKARRGERRAALHLNVLNEDPTHATSAATAL